MVIQVNDITLLGIAASGIGSFLGVFYLVRNRFRNDGYLFLYLLLLLLAYEIFYKTLIQSGLIFDFLYLYVPGRFFNLLVYPVFLFFMYSVTRAAFRLRIWHWAILLVFVLYALIAYGTGLFLSAAEKYDLLTRFYADTRPGSYDYWSNGKTLVLSTLLPVFFIGLIAYDFWQFNRRNHDKPKQRLLYILATVIVLYFLFSQFANLIYRVLYAATGLSLIEWPVDIVFLSLILFLLSIVALSVHSGATLLPPAKYAASSLDATGYDRILTAATRALVAEQLYKEADLTLQKLAKRVGSNASYLSQAINHRLEMGFTDFVNQYRVEEAKQQLVDPSNAHLTIEALAPRCGFKAKSTFFRAFKKATGKTPKQFLDAQRSSNL